MAKLRINLKAFLMVVLLVSPFPLVASPVLQDTLDLDESILVLIDVPLMPGLEELVEEGVLFDKPDGRYIEINLLGLSLPMEDVHDFYKASMVNWGWVMADDSTPKSMKYSKDGEVLTMELSDSDGGLLVKIRLKPVS